MSTIRVAHVLHAFGFGGLEKGIATLIRHGSADFEHLILCLAKTGESESLLPYGTQLLELHKKEGSSLRFFVDLSRKLRALKPDVVHTRNWGGIDGVIAANLAGMRRCVVQGEHGWGMEDAFGKSAKRVWIRRLLSLGVREFTCVSKQMESWLQGEVKVFAPVSQIYNGIDTSLFSPEGKKAALRHELGLKASTKLIGSIGRLDPIKDHVGLIQAFQEVHQSCPDCALIIVGNGPERERLEAMSTPGVYFLGARYEVAQILRDMDIFALASINEGISNTILEAMATGLPVVSTNVGGTPELITHEYNGLLAEPRDHGQLASYLLTYLQAPAMRAEHGQHNRRITQERFSIEAMVQGYELVWSRISGKKS